MAIEILEIGVKLRKVVVFTLRKSYRSVCNHPFLACFLLFLVFLYRSSPFVFSLLVSASPVLVCTAVLLGTLLSFGQPNIPEIEKEENFTNEIGSLRTEISKDSIVVEKNEGYSIERVAFKSGEIVEHWNGDVSLVGNTSRELIRGDRLDSSSPMIEESSHEIKLENEEVEERKLLHELENDRKNEMLGERLVNHGSMVEDEELEVDMDKSPAESFDSERVNVDSLDSPPGSPWKLVEEGEEQVEGEEEDEAEDTESDQAESSSPDASMADIIPMLDELHPLLDDDAPLRIPLSHDGSDAASEHSGKSGDSSSESEDSIEKNEGLDGADEENEDGDDEDEENNDKASQTKASITWTEEDQKNLMDLGSLELERNQRLESLILRRRARKTMSMMPERNLIDLESADLPVNIAPISTSRNNPFDLAHDSYDSMGLPPIPGSAPSILLPRRNPFDIPYDSSEEKPDLMEDSFQQEFSSFQPKEPLFRRRESFNVGPSIFGPSRQEKRDIRLRPFFVPERSDLEESSYSPFQRQSSGLSDSKASSVPETESVVSTGDVEENNLVEEDFTQNTGSVNIGSEIELRSQAGDLETKNSFEEEISEALESLMIENGNLGEEDFSQETEVIAKMVDVSEHVGHGSQSSEEEESSSDGGEVEERGMSVDEVDSGPLVKDNIHKVEHLSIEERSASNPVELHDIEYSNMHLVKQGHKGTSSSSSLFEESEKIFYQREADRIPIPAERSDFIEGTQIPGEDSLQGSDANKESGSLGDAQHKEPIYDSSPPSIRKNHSSSSVLSELNAESEMGFPHVLIKGSVSFAERESESGSQKLEGTSDTKEKPAGNTSAPAMVESVVRDVSVGSQPIFDTSTVGNSMNAMGSHSSTDKQISSSVDANVDGALHLNVGLVPSFSKDQSLGHPKERLHLQYREQVPSVTISGSQSIVEHSLDKKNTSQTESGEAPTPSSGQNYDAVISVGLDEKQIYQNGQHSLEEKFLSDFGEELVFLDRTMDESPSRDQHAVQVPLVMPEEISEELSPRESLNVSDIQDLAMVQANVNSPASPESINIPSEAYESRVVEGYSDDEFENVSHFQATVGKEISAENGTLPIEMQNVDYVEDLIKEIGEELLSELDTVGDFSVKDLNSGLNVFGTHMTSGQVDFSNPHMPGHSAGDETSTKLQQSGSLSQLENISSALVADVNKSNEGLKSVSEPQSSGTSSTKPAELWGKNSIQSEVHDLNGLKPPEKTTLPEENATDLGKSEVENSNIGVKVGMPVIEAQSLKDIEAIFKMSELASTNAEIKVDSSDKPHEVQGSSKDTTSGMPVIEAHSMKDIEAIFKKAEFTLGSALDNSGKPHEGQKSSIDVTSEMPLIVDDQQLGMRESIARVRANSLSSDAEVAVPESSAASDDESKGKDSVLALGTDSDLNKAGTYSDQQSSMKVPIVQENRYSADVSSDPKVAVAGSAVVSHDEGKVKDSVLASGKDSEKNKAGTYSDQQSSMKVPGVQENRNIVDVSLEAKVVAPESLDVSHDEGKGKESVLASGKDSEKDKAGTNIDQQ